MRVAFLRSRAAIALFASLALLIPAVSSAQQLSIPGMENALSISLTPEHPGPNTQVRMKLTSPLYDLADSAITWRAGDALIAKGDGVTEATFTTGKEAEGTLIKVSVSSPQGEGFVSAAIVPATVDLLWEADSLIPPFYRGKALPAAGGSVRIVAMPHLYAGSTELAPESLTYQWKRNGTVLGSLSGKGKRSITIDAPMLYGTDRISVVASSLDGSVAGEASVQLRDADTDLALYLDHPLYGILFHQAIGASAFISDTEMTFAAYPIFGPAKRERDPQLVYEWTVNQSPLKTDEKVPNEITINAANSSGIAIIHLAVSHLKNYFFGAENSWQATFTDQKAVANPFFGQ